MKILITNDDGIESPGLSNLAQSLQNDHEVWIFAPDRERSGQSQSITIKNPLRVKNPRERVFSCDGTPADCVNLAIKGTFVPWPDLILSGINLGPNLGTDTIYSGTVAAARQGTLIGIPSLALSCAKLRAPWDLEGASLWVASHLEELLALVEIGSFLNINFPSPLKADAPLYKGELCVRDYIDAFEKFEAPGKEVFCFFKGTLGNKTLVQGTDWWAVDQGFVSLTHMPGQPLGVNHNNGKKTND